ncbi:MAG: hypothetical protein P1P64_01070 [Treponemataceae bacterium]
MKFNKNIFCLLIFSLLSFSIFAAGKTEKSEITSGSLKLIFYKQSGSFCLYRLSEIGKDNWAPLYDDRALASTNSYSLLVGKKMYRAKKGLGKNVNVENNGNEILVTYTLAKNLFLNQRFYFSAQKYNTSANVLCIETSFENTTGETVDVALRAVFDTNLGEKQRVSLYTDSQSIMSETNINLADSKMNYIASANSISACLFFVRLENQTTPSDIFVANWDYLQSMKWIPKCVEGRSFSTKYYNNDSAIMFVWAPKRLYLNEKYTVTTCIGYNDYLKRDIPVEALEQHLKALPEKERKNYDNIQTLLKQIEMLKANPDKYSDEEIRALTENVDNAILEIQE